MIFSNNPEVEKYYYVQDNQYSTLILISHMCYRFALIERCSTEELKKSDITCLTRETAQRLISGLIMAGYGKDSIACKENTEEEKRNKVFLNKFAERINDPIKASIIEEEKEVYNKYGVAYSEYVKNDNSYIQYLKKSNLSCFSDYLKKKNLECEMSDLDRLEVISQFMIDPKASGIDEVKKELLKDEDFRKAQEIAKNYLPLFVKLIDAFKETNDIADKERELYSKEYNRKMDYFADECGLFLYWQRTPDLPLDEETTSDDIYNFYLADDGFQLLTVIEQFVKDAERKGPINKREADDLISSFHLLLQGYYWAALRNLYALIDHHYDLFSNAYNGFKTLKETYKNGKEKADRIDYLLKEFNDTRLSKKWKKIRQACQEINVGKSEKENHPEKYKRFISRNEIVHGEYGKEETNPTAKDVINIFLLYVSLRQMVDHFKCMEEMIKDGLIYVCGSMVGAARQLKNQIN